MFGYQINSENLKIVVGDISTQLKDVVKKEYIYYAIFITVFVTVITIMLLVPSKVVLIEPLDHYDVDNLNEIVTNNQYIFVGKVVSSNYEYKMDENYPLPYNSYVVEVEEVIKGDLQKEENIVVEKTGAYYKSMFYQYEKVGRIENDNNLLDIDDYYIFAGNTKDDYEAMSLDELRGARPLYNNKVSSIVYDYFMAVKNTEKSAEDEME